MFPDGKMLASPCAGRAHDKEKRRTNGASLC